MSSVRTTITFGRPLVASAWSGPRAASAPTQSKTIEASATEIRARVASIAWFCDIVRIEQPSRRPDAERRACRSPIPVPARPGWAALLAAADAPDDRPRDRQRMADRRAQAAQRTERIAGD